MRAWERRACMDPHKLAMLLGATRTSHATHLGYRSPQAPQLASSSSVRSTKPFHRPFLSRFCGKTIRYLPHVLNLVKTFLSRVAKSGPTLWVVRFGVLRHSDRPGPDCGHRVTPRAITLPRSGPAPLRQGFDEADVGFALSRANMQPNLAIELLLSRAGVG